MLKNLLVPIKLIALSYAIFLMLFNNASYAQVSAPKNLKIDVDSTEATLSWNAPGSGQVNQYFIYKAYSSSKDSDPTTLYFTKFDSTFTRYYTDDLSSVPKATPIVFYYITAEDSAKTESPQSKIVNTSLH